MRLLESFVSREHYVQDCAPPLKVDCGFTKLKFPKYENMAADVYAEYY